MPAIACIVEGHGETKSLPILLRRMALEIDPGFVPQVVPPQRLPASQIRNCGHLQAAIEYAGRRIAGNGGVMVLLDADWDDCCPAVDGPRLLQYAQGARNDIELSVVLAKMEYEAWFLAAADSLRGIRGLSGSLASPACPESIRGAKEWLSRNMQGTQAYSETLHQASFTAQFNMDLARERAPSFDKFYRDAYRILMSIWNVC